MDDDRRVTLEREVRDLCERGDHAAAATVALTGYGPELFGFLLAMHRNETDASDAFSLASEALWRGLATFGWDCSLRTWAYAIARNHLRTARRNAGRKRRHGVVIGDSALSRVAASVRSETLTFLRTETRTRLQALRDSLPEEERMLLVLRIDRQLPWNDLVRVLLADDDCEPLTDARVAKESARLRKRFQVLKDHLRVRAKEEGILE